MDPEWVIKIESDRCMNAWKLRLSMAATLAIIFGLTTLVFTAVLFYVGVGLSLVTIGILVVAMNIGQWLLAPYLIGCNIQS